MDTSLRHKTISTESFDKAPQYRVVWVRCPGCNEDFWFSCFRDTSDEEIQEVKGGFKGQLKVHCLGELHAKGIIVPSAGEKLNELSRLIGLGMKDLSEKNKNIRYKEKIPQLVSIFEEYSSTNDYLKLKPALDIFRETSGLVLEGEDAFGTTIWNSETDILGKATTLESFFNDLEDNWQIISETS